MTRGIPVGNASLPRCWSAWSPPAWPPWPGALASGPGCVQATGPTGSPGHSRHCAMRNAGEPLLRSHIRRDQAGEYEQVTHILASLFGSCAHRKPKRL
jgi:hypothetical protein